MAGRPAQRLSFLRDGIRLLKILTLPDWKERLLSAIFAPELRLNGYGSFEYDGYFEGRYLFSHIDGDLARLIHFGLALDDGDKALEVLCLPWQAGYLREYLKGRAGIKVIDMNQLEQTMGLSDDQNESEE